MDQRTKYLILKVIESGEVPNAHDFNYDHNTFEQKLNNLVQEGYLNSAYSLTEAGNSFILEHQSRYLKSYMDHKSAVSSDLL